MHDHEYRTPYPGVYTGQLRFALQEWAGVCEALGDGRLVLTARKGGIHEPRGGTFSPEHQRFVLLPTHLHQHPDRVRRSLRPDVERTQTPPADGTLSIQLWAECVRTWKIESLMTLRSIQPELAWTDEELATRFQYKDQPWLYVLALRIHRFVEPITIEDGARFAGCRSWIDLGQDVSAIGSFPVLSTGTFEIRTERIAESLREPRGQVPDHA